MNTFDLYKQIVAEFTSLHKRGAVQFEPLVRNGAAKATWLEKLVIMLDRTRVSVTRCWLLSDPNHTLDISDFHTGIDGLALLDIDAPSVLNVPASLNERDRAKMIRFFRADKPGINVGVGLAAVSDAMAAVKTEALSLINTTGDATTIKYTKRDGVVKPEGRTLAEMGVNGAPLADLLMALDAEINKLATVA